MRKRALLLTLIGLATIAEGHAQAAPERVRFNAAFAQDDATGLRQLAGELRAAGTDAPLALLCDAGAAYRANDLAGCSMLLDSCDKVAPTDRIWLRSILARIRSLHLSSLGEHVRAALAADQGLALPGLQELPEEKVALWVVLAEAELGQGRFDAALAHLGEAETLSSTNDFLRGLGLVAAVRGAVHYHRGNYDSAWSEYTQALNISVAGGFSRLSRSALVNLGSIAIMTERYDVAVALFDSLLTRSTTLDAGSKAHALNHLAYVHAARGDHGSALDKLRASMVLKTTSGDTVGQVEVLQNISYSLWETGQQHHALDTMRLALGLARQHVLYELQYGILWDLMLWHRELQQMDSAFLYLRTWADVSDTIQEVKHGKETARAEVLFETGRKERRILEQSQALALAAAEDRRKNIQRIALGISALAVTLIALLLARSLRNRRRLAEQERKLHAQQVDELLKRSEIEALNAMMEGQEKERDRVARDLHDRLGSMLSAIKHQIDGLDADVQGLQVEQRGHYTKVNRMLDEAVGEVRRISHDMVSVTLARFGLEKALEDLCDSVRLNGRLAVELSLFGMEQRMERGLEITVYRMVQELVSNVLKHADAHELSISVTRGPGRISVIVADDGLGFDTSAAADGIGLSNVRARAAAMGAQVTVNSATGKGTTVSIEGPVVE